MFRTALALTALLITAISFPAIAPGFPALTPQEILEKVDETRAPGKSFAFDLTVTSVKAGEESVAEFAVRVKDAKKSLLLYKSPPANKGRVLLMVDENMWIYIPGTRNPIRISPQQQIMGRVANADAARVVYSLDYSADAMAEEVLDGSRVIRLSLSPKTAGAAYKSVSLWVEKGSCRPVKADFHAASGRVLKTAFYKGYKEIAGRQRPSVLEIRDGIDSSDISVMEYRNLRLEDTPDAYFQKTYMERVR